MPVAASTICAAQPRGPGRPVLGRASGLWRAARGPHLDRTLTQVKLAAVLLVGINGLLAGKAPPRRGRPRPLPHGDQVFGDAFICKALARVAV